MSDKFKIDTVVFKEITKEVCSEYEGMFRKLKSDQKALFLKIVESIQVEYFASMFGDMSERGEHEENLRSLRNGLAALEGVAAIRVYRTTINIAARVLVALIKAMAKMAIGL